MWSILHSVETIQVVLDKQMLQAADRAAKRSKINRSALIRDALREHLKRLQVRDLEQREREGYAKYPDSAATHEYWERAAAWPPE
jgi:metal-responsive CopG/Arc/MetJ family transcriptional regulator